MLWGSDRGASGLCGFPPKTLILTQGCTRWGGEDPQALSPQPANPGKAQCIQLSRQILAAKSEQNKAVSHPACVKHGPQSTTGTKCHGVIA